MTGGLYYTYLDFVTNIRMSNDSFILVDGSGDKNFFETLQWNARIEQRSHARNIGCRIQGRKCILFLNHSVCRSRNLSSKARAYMNEYDRITNLDCAQVSGIR